MLVIVLLQNTIMTKLYLPFQGTFIYQSCMLLNYFKRADQFQKFKYPVVVLIINFIISRKRLSLIHFV